MRSSLLCLLSLLAVPAGVRAATDTAIGIGSPALRYIGRNFTSGSTVKWGFSGSGVSVRFVGTGCAIRLTAGGGVYRIRVDGAEDSLDLRSDNTDSHVVASNLAATDTHEVVATVRSEMRYSTGVFTGFTIAGRAVTASNVPARKLEFYGNSMACGYGVLASSQDVSVSAANTDEGKAYAGLVADSLKADHRTICYSGLGVVSNYGDAGVSSFTLPSIYNRIVDADGADLWAFPSTWVPDAVIIDLGTNDYWQNGSEPAQGGAAFEAAFVKFIDTLHARYPSTRFVLLDGLMLPAASLASLQGHLENIKDTVAAQGIVVSRLTLTATSDAVGYGSDYHPNQAQARINSKEIVAYLGNILDSTGTTSVGSKGSWANSARLVRTASGWAVAMPSRCPGADATILDAFGRQLGRLRLIAGQTTALPRTKEGRWVRIRFGDGQQILTLVDL